MPFCALFALSTTHVVATATATTNVTIEIAFQIKT
jgi:hypothetical protein